jgi:hypothetical protein
MEDLAGERNVRCHRGAVEIGWWVCSWPTDNAGVRNYFEVRGAHSSKTATSGAALGRGNGSTRGPAPGSTRCAQRGNRR